MRGLDVDLASETPDPDLEYGGKETKGQREKRIFIAISIKEAISRPQKMYPAPTSMALSV